MKLTYNFTLGNETEIDLFVTFECEDRGWGEGFTGSHGKEVDLSYEILNIECDDPVMVLMLQNDVFYNRVRNIIENDDRFFEQADNITFGNEYEEY
jgi:hypothetical protein